MTAGNSSSAFPRSCGPCAGCCVAPAVEWLEKPPGVPCRHLCDGTDGRCGIYDRRDPECRDFCCFWQIGLGSKQDRPDLVGAYLESREHPSLGEWLEVHETRSGAAQSQAVQNLVLQAKQVTGGIKHVLTYSPEYQLVGSSGSPRPERRRIVNAVKRALKRDSPRWERWRRRTERQGLRGWS